MLYRESVSGSFRKFLRLSRRAVVLYLLAPLMAYGVLGLYVVLALPMGLFDFSAYVEIIADSLRKLFTSMSEEQVIRIATISAYTQVVFAYLAAVTINAFFALGEEIGWRGYLYDLLGYNPSLRNTVIVGVLWGCGTLLNDPPRAEVEELRYVKDAEVYEDALIHLKTKISELSEKIVCEE